MTGLLGSGLWLILIGWFLNNSAKQSYEQLLLRHELQSVPLERVMRTGHTTTVAEVMKPISELPALPPDARAEQALDELTRWDVEQLPVVDHDHMVGLVSRGDLVKWLSVRSGIGVPNGAAPAG
jgi:CBS-domain-containing membrane protein